MRKFRVWDAEDKEFIYFGLWDTDEGYHVSRQKQLNDKIVEQFTGLLDRNGVEIFEGDVVEFSVFDYNGRDLQYKGIVKYVGSRYVIWESENNEFFGSDGAFDLDWVLLQDDEFKIIGNIHEVKNEKVY